MAIASRPQPSCPPTRPLCLRGLLSRPRPGPPPPRQEPAPAHSLGTHLRLRAQRWARVRFLEFRLQGRLSAAHGHGHGVLLPGILLAAPRGHPQRQLDSPAGPPLPPTTGRQERRLPARGRPLPAPCLGLKPAVGVSDPCDLTWFGEIKTPLTCAKVKIGFKRHSGFSVLLNGDLVPCAGFSFLPFCKILPWIGR